VYDFSVEVNVSSPGLLQRFFDFYSVYFGITAPPPKRQKLVVILLIAFVVILVTTLVLVGRFVSTL
jgi:hypothetical protein